MSIWHRDLCLLFSTSCLLLLMLNLAETDSLSTSSISEQHDGFQSRDHSINMILTRFELLNLFAERLVILLLCRHYRLANNVFWFDQCLWGREISGSLRCSHNGILYLPLCLCQLCSPKCSVCNHLHNITQVCGPTYSCNIASPI